MNGEDDLTKSTIAIIGLGLMGGSLAMALRGHCARLLGIDRDAGVLELALAGDIVDEVHTEPANILSQADVVVLAVPVISILEWLKRLPEWHAGPAVVLDLGSTKADILHTMATLPPEFDPVGGHPMCGKETSGLKNADPSLYRGAPFALTALQRTSPAARSMAEQLARAAGASPLWLDAETHDTWVAFTSHVPYLMSVALVQATSLEAASLAGTGFLSATRLAGSDPEMMADILVSNRLNVLEALKQLELQLNMLDQAVRTGDRAVLIVYLEKVRQQRNTLIGARRGDEA